MTNKQIGMKKTWLDLSHWILQEYKDHLIFDKVLNEYYKLDPYCKIIKHTMKHTDQSLSIQSTHTQHIGHRPARPAHNALSDGCIHYSVQTVVN